MRFNVRRTALAAALLAAVGSSFAIANGMWPTLPIVGQPSFCAAFIGQGPQTGGATGNAPTLTTCAQTVPAGPTGLTGNENIPADTELAGGANPQTVTIPVGLLAPGAVYQGSYASPKNLLRNGDISVNPFQRGTSQAADISNTLTYGPDAFAFLGGASSAINWSSQTGATDIVAGQFNKSVRFQRKSANADTAQICQVNVLPSQDSQPLQGQKFVYSFWALPGANFSPTQGNLVVKVAAGTGSNQSAATFVAGTWTNQTNEIVAAGSSSTTFVGSVATATATFTALPTGSTATWTQYWVSGTIPSAIAGSAVTQVGTEICFTPVGTAGANDWIETSNHQLEIVAGSAITPTAFEHRTAQGALTEAQRFFTIVTEPASGVNSPIWSTATAATTAQGGYQFPVEMRTAPTFTALGTALSGSTWTNRCGAVNNALASTFFVTATANTTKAASYTITSSGATAGFACVLAGAAGGSILSWSSEL